MIKIIDNTDLKIINEFIKNKDKETTTWKIMKSIFRDGRNKEHCIIKRRIEKMADYGLFLVGSNSRKSYSLILNNVAIKNFSFPEKRCMGIALKINNKWQIIEI